MAPNGENSLLRLQPAQAIQVRMQPGQHFKVRKLGHSSAETELQVPSDVIATRAGDALHLRYADGSTVTLEDFYAVCKDANVCSVNLASDSEAGITLSADEAAGAVTTNDGSTLVYAHGNHDVLMSMARGDAGLLSALGTLGDAPLLTYLPQSSSLAGAHALGEVAVVPGLFGVTLTADGWSHVGASGFGGSLANAVGRVQGVIEAGPVTAGNDLEVTLYAADGSTVLAEHVAVDGSGHFSATVGNYTGVVIAKLINKGSAADYLDEATNASKDLSVTLMAVGVVTAPGDEISLNLNVLTTLAFNKLGTDHSAANVEAVNAAVAHAFGLSQLQSTLVVTTNGGSYNAADGLSEGEKYGAVLAGLSGMDKLNGGSSQTTIDRLTSQLTVSGNQGALSDAAKYEVTAGAKTVFGLAANQSVVTGQFGDSVAALLNYTADPVAQGLDKITAYAGSVPGTAVPSVFDYANANITGIDSPARLALINDSVHASSSTQVDSVAELQALADAVTAVLQCAAGLGALTVVQLQLLGINGVSVNNIRAIAQAIAASVDDGSAVDTLAELQALVSSAAAAAAAAVSTISAAAENNTANASSPSISSYTNAGVSGVDSTNIAALGNVLNTLYVNGVRTDTPDKIQNVVDAYNAIVSGADGTANNNAKATSDQYTTIGVTGVTNGNLGLINSAIDRLTHSAVDSATKIQAITDAANHVLAAPGGGTSPTQSDLESLGITGITSNNLQAILNAIAGSNGSGLGSIGGLQGIASSAEHAADAALSAISTAAQDNSAGAGTPALGSYTDLGIHGVNSGNLAAINSALNSAAVVGTSVDTTAEVQALVDAYNTILNGADGNANGNLHATADQYATVGLTGVTSAVANLLNSVIDKLGSTAVDTVGELQALADAAAAVIAASNGGTAPTQNQLQLLGITGITADNLAAIQHAIEATANDGSGVDTQTELQTIVSNAAAAAAAALGTISAAAQADNATTSTPAIGVYGDAGVTGVTANNLAAFNDALNSAAVLGTSVDTTAEVQALVDAYNAILASADGVDNVATAANPTAGQYALIGVTGVDSAAKASLLGDVIDTKLSSAVDTVAEVQTLADAVSAVINAAHGGTPPTLTQLQDLGLTGINSDNLAAIQNAINASADDGSGVDTKGELQTIVNSITAALGSIGSYAQANTASAPAAPSGTAPALQTYLDAGVNGVTSLNLTSINDALATAAVTGSSVDTIAEVQALVDAYGAILASADATANNTSAALTGAQYTSIGITGVTGVAAPGNALNLLDSVVDASARTAVDTVAELQTMADAAAAVIAAANGGTPPTLTQIQTLGITGVMADNLAAIQQAIDATANDGSGVDTQADLQTLVSNAAAAASAALNTISAAAEANSANASTPGLSVYKDAGVTGVSTGNLAAINDALDSATVDGASADTTAEVQSLVDAYNAILNGADSTANGNLQATATQYAAIGVTGITIPIASLLNGVIDTIASSAVDTVAEVQALADAATAVMTGAGNGTPPTLTQLQALGITGMTANNLGAVQQAIAATADDGTGVDTVAELQALVSTAAANYLTALGTISTAAQGNSATTTTPALSVYSEAGVTGVNADNQAAINSALDTAAIVGTSVDSTSKVQALVDAYNTILASADGVNNVANASNPSQSLYTAIGVTGVDTASKASLLGDAIDSKSSTAVDSATELQTLADAAAAVIGAPSGGTAPTLTQLQALGITGVTTDILGVVQQAIAANANGVSGVDTLPELQTLVDTITNALATIKAAAFDNDATASIPQASVYNDAGVTGVNNVNLAAINDALNTVPVVGTSVETPAQIQALVDAYNAILAEANGAPADATPGVNPSAAQYALIGAGIGAAASDIQNLALLNDIVGAQVTAGVDSIAEINNLARIANAIELMAAGGAPATALSADDFGLIGLTGITSGNLQAMLTSITLQSDDGSATNTLAKLQALVDSTPPGAPVINTVASDDKINAAEQTAGFDITGTGEAGATLALVFGSGRTLAGGNTVVVGNGGTWSLHVTAADVGAFGQGGESISATQTDSWGNTSTPGTTSLTVDTVAPTTTIATAQLSVDSGIAGDFITNEANQTISGTLSAVLASGETVFVSLNGGASWSTAVTTIGQNTWSLAGQTLSGSGTLSVKVSDSAGNDGPVFSHTYLYDNAALTNTIASLHFSADTAANGSSNNDFNTTEAQQTISGTLSEHLVSDEDVYVSLDNGSTWVATHTAPGSTNWSLSGVTLASSNTLLVKVSDTIGNSGTTLSQAYVLDTTHPTTGITGIALGTDTAANGTTDSDFTTHTALQTISATLSTALVAGETLFGSVDGGATWTDINSKISSGTTIAWDGISLTGSSSIQFKVTDTAGNDGPVASQAYVLDTTAPTAVIASVTLSADTGTPGDFRTKTSAQDIGGTLSESLGAGEKVYVSLDNGSNWFQASVTTTSWSLAGQTLLGNNTLKVKVTDVAGNDGAVYSQAYVLDTTAPGVSTVTDNVSASVTSLPINFTVTFDEAVVGTVGTANFTTTHGTVTAVSALGNNQYLVSVTPTAGVASGNVALSLVGTGLTDAAANTVGNADLSGKDSQGINTVAPSLDITSIAGDVVTGNSQTGVFDAVEWGTLGTTHLVISGTTAAEAGRTLTLTLNNHNYTATVQAGSPNTWSLTLPDADVLALNHGNHYAVLTSVVNEAGALTTNNSDLLFYNIAFPDTPTVINQFTNNLTPVITGQAQKINGGSYIPLANGDTIQITIHGVTQTATVGVSPATNISGITYDQSTSTWSVDTAIASFGTLSDGAYEVAVRTTAAGIQKDDLSHNELVISTAQPSITLDAVSGDDYINATEKTQDLVITGTTDAQVGQTLTIAMNGHNYTGLVLAGADAAHNTFSVTVPTADLQVADNSFAVGASVTNIFGSTSSNANAASVVLDTHAPTVSGVTDDVSAAVTNGAIAFTVSFDNAVVGTVGTGSFTATNGTVSSVTHLTGNDYQVTVNPNANLASGNVTLSLVGTGLSDAAGNGVISATLPDSQAIDTLAPTQTVSGLALSADTAANSGTNSDFNTRTAAQTITATLSAPLNAGDVLWGSVNGGSSWTNISSKVSGSTITWDGATLSGSSSIVFRVADAVGNNGANTGSTSYVLDTVAPTNTIATAAFSADTAANGASNSDFITRTASQTISGTLTNTIAAGETVYVSLDNGSTWNAANASTTTWSLSGVTLSGNGTLQVKVTDTAGNDGAVLSQAYTLDTTAPGTTIASIGFSADTAANGTSNSDLVTATAAQTISGTLSANLLTGEAVFVSLNNGATWNVATATVGQSTWSLSGVTIAGSDTLVVKVTDAAGNDGTALTQGYTLDTTSPTTTISTAVFSADTAANGSSNSDFNTRTAAQTISGTLSANLLNGETVYVSLNNGSSWLAAAATVGANAWSLTGVTLTASSTLLVKVADTAGNQGGVFSQAYVYDTTAPTNSVATAAFSVDTAANGTTNNDFITKTSGQTISGTLATNLAAGESVYVSLDNGAHWTAASSSTNTWSLTGQTLASSNTLLVKVTDLAGNDGAVVYSHGYTLDTTAPTTGIATATFSANSGTNGDLLTNTATQTISGTLGSSLGADETVYVSLNDGVSWTAATATTGSSSWSLANQTLTGSHLLEVKVSDAAGNDGPLYTHSYTFDTTPPAAPTMALLTDSGNGSDGITNVATVNVGGLESNASWQYQVDGGAWSSGTGTSFSLSNGAHSYMVRQTDQAGNPGNASGSTSYTLDTTAPTATITDNVTGTATGAVTFTFTFNEAVTGFDASDITVTNGTKGAFSGSGSTYTMSVTPAAGSGNMTVGLNTGGFADVAGNANAVAPTSDVQPYQGLLGQSVINLGALSGPGFSLSPSKLIAPVEVNGNWYYYWDINGNGVADTNDYWSNHDVLDYLFSQNSAGATNPSGLGADTTDTYRYAVVEGIKLALPTIGNPNWGYAAYASGTALSLNTTTVNPTYTDMTAIWDAYNGTGTGAGLSGVPPNWLDNIYWSATQVGQDVHASIAYSNGIGQFDTDVTVDQVFYVALQVVGTVGPVAPGIALATDSGNSASDGITNAATVNVSGLVANSTWQYRVDYGAWTTGTGTSFAIADGTHTYDVHQKDNSNGIYGVNTTAAYTFDNAAPTLAITDSSPGSVLSSTAVHYTFTFNEAVTGFDASDITVTNGTKGALNGSGSSYSMDITVPATGTGNMSVAVAAGSFSDVAGNVNSVPPTTNVQEYSTTYTGTSSVSLGNLGLLIDPIQVGGLWYYVWDRSGSHTVDAADNVDHNTLDTIFVRDAFGNVNPGTDTNDTYRYATINGLSVALVTAGELGPIANATASAAGWGSGNYFWTASDAGGQTHLYYGPAAGIGSMSDDNYDSNNEYFWTIYSVLQLVAAPPVTLALASDTGTSATDGITSSATVNVGGTIGGDTWQYQVDGGSWITGTGSSFNLSSGTHTYAAHQVAQDGNVSINTGTATYTLDTLAPTVTITDTTGGTVNSGYAHFTFNFNESVLGFTAADITVTNGALGTLTGSGSSYAMDITPVMGSGNMTVGITTGSFSDGAGNVNNVATTSVVQPYNMLTQAGQAVVDLGASGKLIDPVQVEGKWYYFWDKNGDGITFNDVIGHDLLDGIFNHDINGVTNTTVPNVDGQFGTTDTYRYATINGVQVALPTLGATFTGNTFMPGTSASGTGTVDNPTYNDLLAIWDALNGSVAGANTGSNMSAPPPAGWANSSYGSATTTSTGHAYMGFNGAALTTIDSNANTYVALQVL